MCYDIFNSSNNKFYFFTETMEGRAICVATIPSGSYNTSSFSLALGNAMTSATANANIYTVSYSSITMKLSIVQSGHI